MSRPKIIPFRSEQTFRTVRFAEWTWLFNWNCLYFLFLLALRPNAGCDLSHEVSRSHMTKHHSRQDSSTQMISSSQRSLPDNTQHSQQRDIHFSVWIRTHRRAAANIRLTPRGHWDRPTIVVLWAISNCMFSLTTLPVRCCSTVFTDVTSLASSPTLVTLLAK